MTSSMTTAPTNEMLALAKWCRDKMRVAGHVFEMQQLEKCAAILDRLATTPSARDVREALDELLRCANAIVGADPSDSEAAEAFTMFDQARVKARRCLALSNLDAAAPAADGATIADAMKAIERGEYSEMPPLGDSRRPLQAPAHSDAVRDMPPTQEYVLRAMVKNYADGNLWDHLDREVCTKAADEIKSLRATLTAPAAKAPAVSEADVGRIVEEHLDSHTFEKNDDGSIVIDRAGMILTMSEDKRLIQSAAQGGGTKSDGSGLGHEKKDAPSHGVTLQQGADTPTTDSTASNCAANRDSGYVANQHEASGSGTPARFSSPSEPKYGCKRAGGFVDSNCMAACDCHKTMRLDRPSDPPSQEASAPPIAGGR